MLQGISGHEWTQGIRHEWTRDWWTQVGMRPPEHKSNLPRKEQVDGEAVAQLPPRIQPRAVICPVSHHWWALREILGTDHTGAFPGVSPQPLEREAEHWTPAPKSSLPSGTTFLHVSGSELNGGMGKKGNACITLLQKWQKQIRRKRWQNRIWQGSGWDFQVCCLKGKIRSLKIKYGQ